MTALVIAGRLLLGEFLGDADPTGPVTEALRNAVQQYNTRVQTELDRGPSPDLICNHMTAPHGEFRGPARHGFCTRVVAQVAQLVDETLREAGVEVEATPVALADGSQFRPGEAPDPEPEPEPM